MRTRIPGEAEQVLKAIIRKTYGFRKKMDRISISQIAAMTRMSSSHVCRGVKILLNMKMITKKGKVSRPTYGIQKDYEKWKPLPKKVIRPNTARPIRGTQKTLLKKTIIKRSSASPDLLKKGVPDGTHGDKCDAIIRACQNYLNIGCTHVQAGQILKKAEDVGHAIVGVYRAQWITSKKEFIGAVICNLKESRGSMDKDDKRHPGWPDADWDMVKTENERFEKYLSQKHGSSLGKVLKQLASRNP